METWYENSEFELQEPTGLDIYPEIQVGDSFIRSHPDYQLVQWEESTSVIECSGLQLSSTLWTPKHSKQKEILMSPYDHVTKEVDSPNQETGTDEATVKFYVPAKVLGFYRTSEDVYMAIVHSAETSCHTNSLITRQWLLRHELSSVRSVEVSSSATTILVVEEKPGFLFDYSNKKAEETSVQEVIDRKIRWGQLFVEISDVGIDKYFVKRTNKRKRGSD